MNNIRTFIAFVLVSVVCLAALPARASDMSVTVTVDQARLDRLVGRCDGGRSIAVTLVHRTEWSPRGATGMTVELANRDLVGGMPVVDVNIFCGDHREMNLADAVEVSIRN